MQETTNAPDKDSFGAPKLSHGNASQPNLALRDANLGLLMKQAPQDLSRVKQSVKLSLGPIQTKRYLASGNASPSRMPKSLMQASILRSKRQYANLQGISENIVPLPDPRRPYRLSKV